MIWQRGRQHSTRALSKLTLVVWRFFDCYLIKIPGGSIIDAHTDEVSGKRHWRLNVTLKGKWCVIIDKVPKAQRHGSWHFFRPDIQVHSATTKTDTLILSIGVALK